MRLVEFLIHVLEAHAETLRRLAALFGEENLLALLELAGENEEAEAESRSEAQAKALILPIHDIHRDKWLAPTDSGPYSVYSELEGAVREFHLPEVLEFHLWAYPYYRAFIESELDLNSRVPGPGGDTGALLVDEAVKEARLWVGRLPIVSSLALQAERAAHVPWLRFRSSVLKRIGKRPLGPVY